MRQNEVVDFQKFRKAEDVDTETTAPEQQFLPAGTKLLIGQYIIEGYLNSGGFGISYAARDSLNRKIVIKECFPGEMVYRQAKSMAPRSPKYRDEIASIVRNFVVEAHSLANLKHDSIVHVHQIFEENGTAYLAMDFIDGPDLLDLLEARNSLPPKQIQKLTRTMLDAIGYVHRMGMLHRDISPDNILLDRAGEPTLIDFGAARHRSRDYGEAPTRMKFVKDGYSPPEFYTAGAEQGQSSDLYAFAATVHHMITGQAPVDGQSRLAEIAAGRPDPREPLLGRVSGYPARFLKAVDTALEVTPEDRFQSADEWLDMIGRETSRLAAISRPATAVLESLSALDVLTTNNGNTPGTRNRVRVAAGLSGIAILVGAGVIAAQISGVGLERLAQAVPAGPSPVVVGMVGDAPDAPATGSAVDQAMILPVAVTYPSEALPRRAPVMANVSASAAPVIGLYDKRLLDHDLDHDLGGGTPALSRPVADVSRVQRSASSGLLDLPSHNVVLPIQPSVPSRPPLAGKLDIAGFGAEDTVAASDQLGPIRPVAPMVQLVSLPQATVDPQAVADTVPPELVVPGEVLQTQISYSYWDVAMPFRSQMAEIAGAPAAVITSVDPEADLSISGTWIAEGVAVTAFNGEPLQADTPLSVLVLDSLKTQTDGLTHASVEYRSAGTGFLGRGELTVPVVRKIGLVDGTVFETRRIAGAWATTVRERGPGAIGLERGDVIMGEMQTNRWFDGYQSFQATLKDLAALGTDTANFTVLRGGQRETARLLLARE